MPIIINKYFKRFSVLIMFIIFTIAVLIFGLSPATAGEISSNQVATLPAPTVTGITPNSAVNAGTVKITDLSGTDFRSGARIFLLGPSGTETVTVEAENVAVESSVKITCDINLKGVPKGNYDINVINDDGQSGILPAGFSVMNPIIQPGPAPASSTWYLAEGTNAWGFNTYISIANPNNMRLTARVTYMDLNGTSNSGKTKVRDVSLAPLSQTTVDPRWDLDNIDFSTKVECLEGETIAVDRTMFWTGEGAASPEGHSSIGVNSASTSWYLPEGSCAWGFETWTLVENPNAEETKVTLTYMIEGKGPKSVEKTVPAYSRSTWNMADDLGLQADASVKVISSEPVIAEQSQYKNNRREGSCSVGAVEPTEDYYLAEGSTAYGFTTYILVQNPNDEEAEVTLTYMTNNGPKEQPKFTVEPNSRKTIRVNDTLANTDFSTLVHGSQPVIAGRSMYWGEGTLLGEAMHSSIGLTSAHTDFKMPDGQAGNSYETYALVQNPNDGEVKVEVSYLPQGGGETVTFTDSIPANSRKTYSMADKGINGRAAIMITSKTTGKKIMCERAMYWNNRGAGTDTIGGFSD